MRPLPHTLTLLTLLMALLPAGMLGACGRSASSSDSSAKAPDSGALPDTLTVGTLYSPQSYFMYRDQEMGYEYELMSKFAADHKIPMRVVLAADFQELLSMLADGRADVLAYPIPRTAEYKQMVRHCGPRSETHQVLVQPSRGGHPAVTNVTQLPGKKVYVEKDSKYWYRLQNLNREVGGGIDIVAIDRDSVVTEDMIDLVARDSIPFTVVDSDIARVSRTYYDDIDVSLAVGMAQESSWAVAPSNEALARSLDAWSRSLQADESAKALSRRYFELSKHLPDEPDADVSAEGASPHISMLDAHHISRYDDIFRRYAKEIGWDWRLLAAIAWNESRFDNSVVSWAGARGLMQLMPRTAQAMGVPAGAITDPEQNVKGAAKAIKALDKMFADKVKDPAERIKFITAAYNSGGAHILDAIAIARQCGRDPQVWEGNVEEGLRLKSNPAYYRAPGVKYGYFKGSQTIDYVRKVMATYRQYQEKIAN